MSASLYEMTANYMAALDFLTDPENEIDQQTLIDTMEAIDATIDDKLINVGKFVLSIENQAEGIKEAEKRMEARRKALENKAEWLREYMKASMENTGKTKLSAPDIALSLAKLPPIVFIDDIALIPPEFFEPQPPKLLKTAIKQAGGCPGARIESAGYRLSIK
jgi:hypothetical protein